MAGVGRVRVEVAGVGGVGGVGVGGEWVWGAGEPCASIPFTGSKRTYIPANCNTRRYRRIFIPRKLNVGKGRNTFRGWHGSGLPESMGLAAEKRDRFSRVSRAGEKTLEGVRLPELP